MTAPRPLQHGDDLLAFVQAGTSPYHAVEEATIRLRKAGFRELSEDAHWADVTGGCFVADGGTLIAWYAPPGTAGRTPIRLVAANTDAPNLRIGPTPDAGARGWQRIAVDAYGPVRLNSWLDRDLGVSGRLALYDGTHRLVSLDSPLLRAPQPLPDMAPAHGPVRGGQGSAAVWGLGGEDPGRLLSRLASEVDVHADDVVGHDLMLHDMQPPAFVGEVGEFVASARLNNLISVHAGFTALLSAVEREPSAVVAFAAFDHLAARPGTASGAQGARLTRVLRRSVEARGGCRDDWERAVAGMLAVAASMTDALHPDSPEPCRPLPNGGPLVRDGTGTAHRPRIAEFVRACDRAGVPWQSCGGGQDATMGSPVTHLLAAGLGIPVIDVGVPGLSLHSVRELCGSRDPGLLTRALAEFLLADPAP
ncbi:M18 family aminopeptidase [Streptomyces sp. RPA4-5]|uniref:M18 family aminopeptidase n=1 Tax=Streptomyces sp. RPA4-5 TaxID=2721245 RepID=UPI00143EA313|nr:M18 family aminopeptidase [Streptomyces sp. RPA4-5]QIY58995.1 M18 family aminopeptidase [Streptomyces sp. RPA4-5]